MKLTHSSATVTCPSRRLAVKWLEPLKDRPVELALRNGRREFFFAGSRCAPIRKRGILGLGRAGLSRAFTLLELMVVLGIIGFLAAMTLPHVANYNRANAVSTASRQLLDAVSLARSRAMANRSTVCLVFVPPIWNAFQNPSFFGLPFAPANQAQLTNLLAHQYTAYALLSMRTVGDQPGRSFPHYLTEWQTLPTGVYVWPYQFNPQSPAVNITTTNTFNGSTDTELVPPFATNQFPFPSINAVTFMNLPYIAFTPQGTLLTQTNQYIVLARGSIFYPQDVNGNNLFSEAPNIVETPPGNETNNPVMIKIDWLTARPTIVQNQFQ
jgi:prepilin-type N-terminal cleavage/methylation domain-containing protein